jgi:hypothetical protein
MPEQSLEEIRQYIDEILEQGNVNRSFYEKYGQYMTEEMIDKALDIGKNLWDLYLYVGKNFTPENIDKALEIGKDLKYLYLYVGNNFTPEQINKALEIGKDLGYLYQYAGHRFTPEQLEKAMEISDEGKLNILFNTVREKRPDLFEVVKQYKIKQVIEQYPQAKYFDHKTYKVNRFIDALKIIRQDMLEGR